MKDYLLKQKVERLTTYTDNVTPQSWCELVDELVNEIESLENQIMECLDAKDYGDE